MGQRQRQDIKIISSSAINEIHKKRTEYNKRSIKRG